MNTTLIIMIPSGLGAHLFNTTRLLIFQKCSTRHNYLDATTIRVMSIAVFSLQFKFFAKNQKMVRFFCAKPKKSKKISKYHFVLLFPSKWAIIGMVSPRNQLLYQISYIVISRIHKKQFSDKVNFLKFFFTIYQSFTHEMI